MAVKELPTIYIKANPAANPADAQPKARVKPAQVSGASHQNHAKATAHAQQRSQELHRIVDTAKGASTAIHKSAARFGQFALKTIKSSEEALGVLRMLYAQSPIKAAEELQKMALAVLKPTKQGGIV